jgi:hypothetical protein
VRRRGWSLATKIKPASSAAQFAEGFPDENVSLYRRQSFGDEVRVYEQAKHRPRVAGRFGLNHNLSNHDLSSTLAACQFAKRNLVSWNSPAPTIDLAMIAISSQPPPLGQIPIAYRSLRARTVMPTTLSGPLAYVCADFCTASIRFFTGSKAAVNTAVVN